MSPPGRRVTDAVRAAATGDADRERLPQRHPGERATGRSRGRFGRERRRRRPPPRHRSGSGRRRPREAPKCQTGTISRAFSRRWLALWFRQFRHAQRSRRRVQRPRPRPVHEPAKRPCRPAPRRQGPKPSRGSRMPAPVFPP